MATRSRRGSFGLQPRVAPNVTGQIIALAREYVAKRDANIMDAWRQGGTFEGKKATDDMVLAYWKGRGKDLSPDDPEYESAKNNITQLTYAIEQSKASVRFAQGKMNETQYAQFFLNWAKKVPKNSEFYRVLQKDAAQLIESAKAKARVNGERARVEAFNSFVKSTTERSIAIGDAMTAALTDLSKQTGLSITGNGDELLALLTQNVKANPDQYRRLLDTIKRGDPDWGGQLTQGYFKQQINAAVKGYDLIADRAQKGGFMSAYTSATQGMTTMSSWGQNVRVWPVSQTYSNMENAFLRVWNSPTASQMEKQAAANGFSAALTNLANTPGIDPGSKTMIEADAMRLLGQDAGDNPSFGTAMLGRPGVDPKMTMQLGAWSKMSAEMAANPTAWAYAPVDQNGQVDPSGRGPLGIVPAGAIQPGANAVMVPGSDGKAVMAMVSPRSVYSNDPTNPSAAPKLIGFQISYTVGGKTIEMWGYKDAQGGNHWSLTSPIANGASTTTDNKGDIFVTPGVTSVDPLARAAELDAKLGTNMVDQLKAQQKAGSPLGNASVTKNTLDKNGRIIGSIELSFNNGTFTATEKLNTLDKKGRTLSTQSTPIDITTATANSAFSPSSLTAGTIPGVTFSSPMQASIAAARQTQTMDQVAKFASDPAFQQAFLQQTMQTLGTQNPYDARIAEAWKDVTTATNIEPRTVRAVGASKREDLMYPGNDTANVAAYNKQVEVNFGGQKLTIPGLPSYLQNQQATIGSGGSAASWATASPWAALVPGLGLPQQTAVGTPSAVMAPPAAIKTTPPPATTPTPSLVPAPSVAPIPRPAPVATPKPSPTNNNPTIL